MPASDDQRIDVHAHYLPPSYRAAVEAAGHGRPDGIPGMPAWEPADALATMDRLGIKTAVLSISSPGIYFGDARAAAQLARETNQEGARLVVDYPGRFGLFAVVPLPDVKLSLVEAGYALDTLGADGIAVKTNHDGRYLGDPLFDPFFEDMNRRGAVVFIHPTSPCCADIGQLSMGYPRPLIEFFFETTRAVTNLILSGTIQRYPRIRFIVPHAGATLPILAERVAQLAPIMGLPRPITPDEVYSSLRSLHFDLAGFPIPRLLDALLGIADMDNILYGSDWPFTPEAIARDALGRLETTPLLNDSQRQQMFAGNARRLLPRIA